MSRASMYLHIETHIAQSPKRPRSPCGDVTIVERQENWTTLLLADGIGSGVKANLAATLAAHRLIGLQRRGFTLRDAFGRLVKTMNANRDPSLPYAAFAIARILPNGLTTVLSYEMPAPILLQNNYATVLRQRTFTHERAILGEATCQLDAGEGLVLVSDGITQAGLGKGYAEGWTEEGACRYLNQCLRSRVAITQIPQLLHDKAKSIWDGVGDDCSVALAVLRKGIAVNILTGPPADKSTDKQVVADFMASEGLKIVCGGSTSAMLANVLGRHVDIQQDDKSLIAPPRCKIDGIDLVTEGAVTLNQAYNILDADAATYSEVSSVTELCCLLQVADKVSITMGSAKNPAGDDIAFRQQGIINRSRIVELLAGKLREMGKLVILKRR
ncbi:MAG: SpoIIE family protein phosphatase [Planctomycetes bacterium]|nr:SpoIIE family protein phosphatase [Planctomycetota bacterium]